MRISQYRKIVFSIVCLLTCMYVFAQNKYPPVKYKAFAMCILKKGDSLCNWKQCNVDIQLNLKGDTLNNISISGAKHASYTVRKKTKSYGEVYSEINKTEKNKIYWDFYDVYDSDLMEECIIQWGIFDYAVDGQVSAMSIYLSDFTVSFKLKVP